MDNSDKIILDLCGGTGSWSKPYKDAGYDVRVITLPDYDVSDVVFSDDYIVFNKQTYEVNDIGIKYADVYGILAAPPCTEFSLAKTTAPRNLQDGMSVVRAVLEIIWKCQFNCKLKFWALENPKGLLVRFLGHPAFKFEQWQFGGTIEKPTYIWGYFNNPKTTVFEKPYIEKFRNAIDNHNLNSREYASPKCPPEYAEYINRFSSKEKRAAIRAITPPSFAHAFFKANR